MTPWGFKQEKKNQKVGNNRVKELNSSTTTSKNQGRKESIEDIYKASNNYHVWNFFILRFKRTFLNALNYEPGMYLVSLEIVFTVRHDNGMVVMLF